MKATRALTDLPAQLRSRRFARECEQLRPLGEAYVLRRFGGSLNRADAEDAVSEVLLRLHRKVEAGQVPQNFRAAFFASVRNAAIDQLRSRLARPTVALEAALDAPAPGEVPAERAEGREDAARLQEALGRMRGNYREAILLRFGLGMTVPEIAEHCGISLPAAKKLVLRATAQVRKRLEAIEGQEFCPQMRELAHRSLFDKEATGLAEEAESRVLHAHFEHCGSCRSFLTALHGNLHEFGAGALLATKLDVAGHLARFLGGAGYGVQVGAAKARFAAYKATGAIQPGDAASAGAVAGAGQKIAAICTAGAATAATCLATGIVGPGLGVSTSRPLNHDPRPARVRAASEAPPPVAAPVPETVPVPEEPAPEAEAPEATPSSEAAPPSETPAQQSGAEFGIESSPPPAPEPESAPPVSSSNSSSSPSTSSGSGGGAGSQAFGFQG